jgi:hypothetical protein
LRTKNPVKKVAAFYKKELAQGGWTLVSSSVHATAAYLVARQGDANVVVSIKKAGHSATSVFVTTFKT